jgi:hypothetical protein
MFVKKIMFGIIALGLLVNPSFARDEKVSVDYAGMEYFLQIAEILRADQEPPEALWEKMFQTSPYACAIQTEFSEKFFRRYYRLAFKPSERDKLDKELEKEGFYIAYLRHMVKINDHWDLVKKRLKAMKQDGEIFEKAVERTASYLPGQATAKYPGPHVGFLIFGPDGRGYETILIDFLFFIQNRDYAETFLAHEFHHHYESYYSVNQAGEKELVWVFDQVYKEGIADLIDKREGFYNDGVMSDTKWAGRYRELVGQAPQTLRKIDRLLAQITREPSRLTENAEAIKDLLPMSGHTVGYYMADAVLGFQGKQGIMKDFGNPYRFFRRYQKMALQPGNDHPAFSEEAMEVIRYLDRKYSRTFPPRRKASGSANLL